MGNLSSVLTGHRAKLSKAGKKLLDEFIEESIQSSKKLSDEEKLVAVQKKMDELLVNYALPAILMIRLDSLVKLGTFPRCPNNVNITCTLDSIDRDNSFLVFISHCWMRGYSGAEGWDGRPHPDNAPGDKFKMCVKGIDMLKKTFAPRMKECYVWLDFGCINQDGNPAGELEQLDKIVQVCDCIFTPVVDHKHASWSFPASVTNFFDQYRAPLWNEGPHAYLNRGWCRVEMLYAANIPVQKNENPDVERHTMFEAGLAYHCSKNRRPHFLYGTKEYEGVEVAPLILPPLQHSYLTNYHPLQGNLSVASDMQHIETLIAELQPYLDANEITVGYQGDYNDEGEKHGFGLYVWEDGDEFEGEYKNDSMHKGTFRYVSGSSYEGEFRDNLKHGIGIFRYPDGTEYEGEWQEDQKHGRGVFTMSDGDKYEGEFRDDKINGYGVYSFACGDVYEGEYKDYQKHGQGTFRFASGTVYEGGWKEDKKHGKGTFRYASGEVFEAEWEDDEPVGQY